MVTSELLANISVRHRFFGKCLIDDESLDFDFKNSPDVAAISLKKALKFLRVDKCYMVDQIHSNIVYHTGQISGDGDGLISFDEAIAIKTADCVPILLSSRDGTVVAALHAGWKGAMSGIVQSAMEKIDRNDMCAAIGPCIHQKSYEVGQDLYDQFTNLDQANEEFFIDSYRPEHYKFDLPGYIIAQLRKCGVQEIDNVDIDTYTDKKKFFSYRRSTHNTEEKCGRNLSIIIPGKLF